MDDFIVDKETENEAFLIHEIARGMRLLFDRRFSASGLTRTQWQALSILRRRQGIRQVELAHRMEIEPISLGRLLDRMETVGLIERKTDPSDRRANRIYLAKGSEKLIMQMMRTSLGLRNEALKGFNEKEHRQLIKYLVRIKSNTSAMGAQ